MTLRTRSFLFTLAYMCALNGCAHDIDRSASSAQFRAHLEELAPSVTGSVIDSIRVSDVVVLDEFTRQVHFIPVLVDQTAWDGVELDVIFHRSDEGWRMTDYGFPTRQLIAGLMIEEARLPFLGLIEALDDIREVVADWRQWLLGNQPSYQVRWSGRPSNPFRAMGIGPSRDAIQSGLEDAGLAVSDSIVWDIHPGDGESIFPTIRVALRSDPSLACATGAGWLGDFASGPGPDVPESFLTYCEDADDVNTRFNTEWTSEAIWGYVHEYEGVIRR